MHTISRLTKYYFLNKAFGLATISIRIIFEHSNAACYKSIKVTNIVTFNKFFLYNDDMFTIFVVEFEKDSNKTDQQV